MKRTILISLAAGVAIVPALFGVAAATNGPSRVDDSRTPSSTASATVDDRGSGGHGADDAATSASPTGAVSSADDRDRGADDATASSAATTEDRRGSDDATASSSASTEDRHSRGTDDATAHATKSVRSSTVDDKGHGVEAGDDSGGHGGKN